MDKIGTVIKWQTNTEKEWLIGVDKMDWEKISNNRVRKSGKCPICQHDMERVVDLVGGYVSVKVLDFGKSEPESETTFEVDIACDCDQDHPDRPTGKKGCGRSGIFTYP